jgi:putative glutamine amidotransferase
MGALLEAWGACGKGDKDCSPNADFDAVDRTDQADLGILPADCGCGTRAAGRPQVRHKNNDEGGRLIPDLRCRPLWRILGPMSRRRRVILTLLAVLLGTPTLLLIALLAWRSTPPEGGPRIGLSTASGFVVQRAFYEDALARAGGRAVLITPADDDARLTAILDEIDALLLTGGGDVDPALYGGDPGDAGSSDRRRDEFEIRLIRRALERDMPILGICRGIQILNVAHGGTVRNLRSDAALCDRHGIDMDSFTAHEVDIAAGTHLAEVLGAHRHRVNSFHGQAVGRVGADLRVCATADDGVIEGVERRDRAFVIGIQWHPEITSLTNEAALALFRALVRQAEAYRAAGRLTPAATDSSPRE